MSPASKSAASIRRRLLIFLVPLLALALLAGVLANYRAAMLFVRDTYDQRLGDTALALAARVRIEGEQVRLDGGPLPVSLRLSRAGVSYYSLVAPGARLLEGNPQLPAAPAGAANPSYATVRLGAREVRVATYRLRTSAGTIAVSAAETLDVRNEPEQLLLAGTWLINFIQLDVILLVVWLGVYYGLKPLAAVRGEIEARTVGELQPLETSSVPAEVRPLVDALNGLFDMLREGARSQRQFVADTAHQLRTPLAGLIGQLELLMREPAAAPVEARLTALHAGLRGLSHSANQLLALARADPSANAAEPFEPIELKSLVERIVENNIDRAAASQLDLGAEAEPATIAGSARLIEDLLGNLVDNALSYTPAGGHVTVRSGLQQGRPYLEVEDDGPGIPESERLRVRQRFYRLPGSGGSGCGLGLAIVEEIARLHGGVLAIDSGAGGNGTRVTVRFAASSVRAPAPVDRLRTVSQS